MKTNFRRRLIQLALAIALLVIGIGLVPVKPGFVPLILSVMTVVAAGAIVLDFLAALGNAYTPTIVTVNHKGVQ